MIRGALAFLGLPAVLPWLLLAALAAGGALYVKGRWDGAAEERTAAGARAQRAAERAQAARDRVDACLDAGGRWVQRDGRCQLPGVPGAGP